MPFRSIVHPSDFSELSINAFAHALKLALVCRGRLDIVHIASHHDHDSDAIPPSVRHVLSIWGLAKESESPASVAERLNFRVSKIALPPQDAASGILKYLAKHPSD